jgi:NAD(P)-dependent dehydrogenase (short-subunit alcohol dehydrogenase family)
MCILHSSGRGNETVNSRAMILENKVAIVTGGDSGIGHAICLGLPQAGAVVTTSHRYSQAAVKASLQRIMQEGDKAEIFQCDFGTQCVARQMIKQGKAATSSISPRCMRTDSCRATSPTSASYETN